MKIIIILYKDNTMQFAYEDKFFKKENYIGDARFFRVGDTHLIGITDLMEFIASGYNRKPFKEF